MSESTESVIRRVSDLYDGKITDHFRRSVATDPEVEYGFFSLEYQWLDKPHRHVFNLCDMLDEEKARAEKAEARVKEVIELCELRMANQIGEYDNFAGTILSILKGED